MIISFQGIEYDCDKILSNQIFTNRLFLDSPIDFSNKTIYDTCFYNEIPDSVIFKPEVRNVTFVRCNLDNIILPNICTVISCSQARFKCQNDGNDWFIDVTNKPIKPIGHEIFTKFALPIPDPKDIPNQKAEAPLDLLKIAKDKAGQS